MVTQKISSTPMRFFPLLASISGSVFYHPAENKVRELFFFYSSVINEPLFQGKKKRGGGEVGSHIVGEIIFLMGYKTLCVKW